MPALHHQNSRSSKGKGVIKGKGKGQGSRANLTPLLPLADLPVELEPGNVGEGASAAAFAAPGTEDDEEEREEEAAEEEEDQCEDPSALVAATGGGAIVAAGEGAQKETPAQKEESSKTHLRPPNRFLPEHCWSSANLVRFLLEQHTITIGNARKTRCLFTRKI